MFSSFNARALGLTLSADRTISLAAESGFGGVDLMVRDAIEQGVNLGDLRRKMDDLGLQPGAFPFPFDWRGDEESYLADLRRLADYADAAARLGLRRTATWVMPECPEGLDLDSTYRLHLDRLVPIAKVLDAFEIHLGLETIGVASSRPGRNVPFIFTLGQLAPLLRELATLSGGRPGIVADSWHLHAVSEPVEDVFALGADGVVWVHVADLPVGASLDRAKMIDSERGLPGDNGAINSSALLFAMAEAGYDGPVTAEPLAKCRTLAGFSPEDAARKAAESLRSIWPTRNGKSS